MITKAFYTSEHNEISLSGAKENHQSTPSNPEELEKALVQQLQTGLMAPDSKQSEGLIGLPIW